MSLLSSIDLHTSETVVEALDLLEHEVFLLYKKGERECRVIHGIGAGVLAGAVHEALTRNPLVREYVESEDGGSCIVYI